MQLQVEDYYDDLEEMGRNEAFEDYRHEYDGYDDGPEDPEA